MADHQEPSEGDETASGAGLPLRKHTRRQKIVRELFKFFGPAQTGLPPYATPAEREAWRRANAPLPTTPTPKNLAPPGFRLTTYTDASGVVRRSLVPDPDPPGGAPDSTAR